MKKYNNIIIYFVLLIFAGILILMSTSCPFSNVGLMWDAAVYLNVSRNLVDGAILYKDIVDNKGPILYFINYIGLKYGGQILVCIIEFIFIYVSFIYIYKSLKMINDNKFRSLIVTLIAFIFYAKFFTYGLTCESYALTFSMITLYECIKFYKNNYFTELQCLKIGILFALTFFIRPNLVVVFAGFGIGIGVTLLIEKRFKELIKCIAFSFVGILIISIPIVIYLIANDCLDAFIENFFLMNLSMNKIGILKSFKIMNRTLPILFSAIYIYVATAIYQLYKGKKISISILITICVTILANSVSKQIFYHYFIIFIPIIALVFDNILNIILKLAKNKKITIYIYLIIIGAITCYVILNFRIFVFEVRQPNKQLIEYVKWNTDIDDKIAVLGFKDEIYYLSNRKSTSRITYILTNNAFKNNYQCKILEEYIGDVIKNKPKIIIESFKILDMLKENISLAKYENLKENEYIYVGNIDNAEIFKLNE